MTTQLEQLPRIAAEAGWAAASILGAAKFGTKAKAWVDLTPEEQALNVEVAKSVIGIPNALTPEDEVYVGDTSTFIAVVRQSCVALGFTIIVPLPQFQQPAETAETDEPSFDDYPSAPEEVYDDPAPSPRDTIAAELAAQKAVGDKAAGFDDKDKDDGGTD